MDKGNTLERHARHRQVERGLEGEAVGCNANSKNIYIACIVTKKCDLFLVEAG